MKLILDSENSYPTTITVKGKEIILLLIESSILIDSSQIAKIFDKKEKDRCRQGAEIWTGEIRNRKCEAIEKIWINASGCC